MDSRQTSSIKSNEHDGPSSSHVGGGTGTHLSTSSTDVTPGELMIAPQRGGKGPEFAAVNGQEFSRPRRALPPQTTEPSECNDLGTRDHLSTEQSLIVPLPERYQDEALSDFIVRQYECLDVTKFDKSKDGFLPKPLLEAIITEATVVDELLETLRGYSKEDITRFAKRICGTDQSAPMNKHGQRQCYRVVFVVLARICKLASIADFLNPEIGVTDADLPLEKVEIEGTQRPALRRRKDLDTPIACFKKWASFYLEGFYEYQWTLLAPFFSLSDSGVVRFQQFHRRSILPFTENSPLNGGQSISQTEEGGKGGFGEVRMVAIHPSHHNFQENFPLVEITAFALKRLKTNERSLFDKEVSMLRRFSFSHNTHPHLITLLTTFEQDGSFFLLFPCANSDLLRYWTTTEPDGSADLALWVSEQCLGMVDGLSSVHNYTYNDVQEDAKATSQRDREALHGRHGDIKPENILWFETVGGERGTLVISDFGCTVFNTKNSCSGVPNDKIPLTPTYRPPEADIRGATISRSWDIWTLGCVYLEFLTWMLGGAKLFEKFTDKRLELCVGFSDEDFRFDTYFNIVVVQGQGGQIAAAVKPQVTTWITDLHNHPSCTDFVHDFLNLVQNEMIIVESATRKRSRCDRLKERLGEMNAKCLASEEYCSKPTPREVPECPNEAVVVPMSDKVMNAVRKNVARDRNTLIVHGGPAVEGPKFEDVATMNEDEHGEEKGQDLAWLGAEAKEVNDK